MISWFEKHHVLSWLITFLIAGTIFYVSSLTFESAGTGSSSNIKTIIYHILIFFIFSFFLMIASVKGKNKELIFLAVPIAVLYGISDEIHQYFVPGRYSTIFDIFLNSVGILFAFMIYFITIVYREKTK